MLQNKTFPAGMYSVSFNNKNTKTMCKACSKLTMKTPEERKWRRSGVFTVDFEQISHIFLVFLLLTLNIILLPGLGYAYYKSVSVSNLDIYLFIYLYKLIYFIVISLSYKKVLSYYIMNFTRFLYSTIWKWYNFILIPSKIVLFKITRNPQRKFFGRA